MRKSIYHEVQTLRRYGWIWVLLIASALGAMVPLLIGAHDQLVKGQPWGDEPMTDTGLILLICFIALTLAVAATVMYFSKMELQIDETGILYRLFPGKPKWKKIHPGEISGYEIKPLGFFKSIILKRGSKFLDHKNLVNLTGTNQLILDLKNGRTIIIGTTNPQGIEWAMRRLLERH